MPSHAQQQPLDGFSLEPASPPTATVYTDGGCDPNPGPGGWAAVLHVTAAESLSEIVLTGNTPHATNNRMELEAAIAALAYLGGRYGRCAIQLHTDSTYVRNGIDRWIERWVANGWQTKGKQAVKNRDLWHALYELTLNLEVEWHWVKGHAGDPLNERVDRLATQARARLVLDAAPAPDPAPAPAPPPGPLDGPAVQISVAASRPGARGPGGWAAALSSDTAHTLLCGHAPEATNIQLVLQAALAALRALETPTHATVYTTEEYLAKGASEWVRTWQQRGWTTSANKPVQHRELWQALLEAARPHHVVWQFVRKRALTADLTKAKQAATQAAREAS